AFLLALGLTLGVSTLVVVSLWRPLYGILVDLCGSEKRADFWRCYTCIMLTRVPLAAVMLGRTEGHAGDPFWIAFLDQAKWAVLGLILALFVVAMGIATFVQTNQSAKVSISRDQLDDLQRLMAKVEEIRARQVLRHVEESEARPVQ